MAVHEVLVDPRISTTFSKPLTTGFSIPNPSMISQQQVYNHPMNSVNNNGEWSFNFKSKGSIITGILILVVIGLIYYTSSDESEKSVSKSKISRQNIQYF